jgi:DNA-binding transcriptional ArsR family regulator
VDTVGLLLHPVRQRIVHAMSGDRTRTTSELCAALPDIPKTSVYRHVGLLADAGVLEVVDERRVHGAVERHYRLRPDRTRIDLRDAESMTLADHRRGFGVAMAVLQAEFNAYLDREGADPVTDGVGYRQGTIWLSHEELTEMVEELRAVLMKHAGTEPAQGCRPYLMSTIFFPTEEPSVDHE